MYLSRFTKVHKKKENNAFKFLKAIVFIYDVFTKYVEYNKEERKRKRFYETCSFVRKCDRSNRCKGGNYRPWLS